jgi:hypothetical protein
VDTYLIDYSASKLAAAVIKATAVGPAGEHPVGAIRYIDAPNLLGTKHTNLVEYQDHVRNGLTDYLFFEIDLDDVLGGYAGGQANAQRALAGANYLGYPSNYPITMCNDRWFNQKNRPLITPDVYTAYLDGAASVLGIQRTGAYGFSDSMDAAVGHASFFVQCGARSVVRSHVHIWQDNNFQPYVGGIQTDRLLVLKPINQGVPDMQPGDKFGLHSGKTISFEDWLKDVYNAIAEKYETKVPVDQRPPLAPGEKPFSATPAEYTVGNDAYLYAAARDLAAIKAELAALKAAPVTPAPAPAAPVALTPADLDVLAVKVAGHLATLQFKATP